MWRTQARFRLDYRKVDQINTDIWLKKYIPRTDRCSVQFGFTHNKPWSRYNKYAYFSLVHRRRKQTVAQYALFDNQLMTFASLVKSSPLLHELSGPGPFTLLVPSNAALQRVKLESWAKLVDSPARVDLS